MKVVGADGGGDVDRRDAQGLDVDHAVLVLERPRDEQEADDAPPSKTSGTRMTLAMPVSSLSSQDIYLQETLL
jgi:hypothetical protein